MSLPGPNPPQYSTTEKYDHAEFNIELDFLQIWYTCISIYIFSHLNLEFGSIEFVSPKKLMSRISSTCILPFTKDQMTGTFLWTIKFIKHFKRHETQHQT